MGTTRRKKEIVSWCKIIYKFKYRQGCKEDRKSTITSITNTKLWENQNNILIRRTWLITFTYILVKINRPKSYLWVYLFIINLRTQSETTQDRMKRWFMNNKMTRIWEEVIAKWLKVIICRDRGKQRCPLSGLVGLRTQVWNWDLPITRPQANH
jgi:hypothetical protein